MYIDVYIRRITRRTELSLQDQAIGRQMQQLTGLKVSRNIPERHSGAWKFKPRAFQL